MATSSMTVSSETTLTATEHRPTDIAADGCWSVLALSTFPLAASQMGTFPYQHIFIKVLLNMHADDRTYFMRVIRHILVFGPTGYTMAHYSCG